MELTYGFKDAGRQLEEGDIKAFESEIGTRLPTDFRSLLLAVNGGYPANDVFEYGDDYSFVLQQLFPLTDEKDSFFNLWHMNCRARHDAKEETLKNIPVELLIIGISICGDNLCLGIRAPHVGKVFWINHEERDPDYTEDNEWLAVEELSSSFAQFMRDLKRSAWKVRLMGQ